ncbi:50S ribosomal protein L30 [Desulfohalobiaceae bacterium Ax17]|uniref:50S ribosomal protein L30 n=1 Tax=Desulfovulcanus ferrireducens TaxID=2831190 RepID=UPI00207BA60C|nr:50S ribosomal protein L30 [Desulfovulcanus ferrireducens]MBT8762900.1 50S ribosomal protein L30 [Desulfovulcanus ferrireducens]
MIKVKLIKSTIGAKPKQKKTIQALGFKKLNQVRELPKNEAVLGMIKKVDNFVEVVE